MEYVSASHPEVKPSIFPSTNRKWVVFGVMDAPGVAMFGLFQRIGRKTLRLRCSATTIQRSEDSVEIRVPLVWKSNPAAVDALKAEIEGVLYGAGIKKVTAKTDDKFAGAIKMGMRFFGKEDSRIKKTGGTLDLDGDELNEWVWELDDDPTNN